MEVASNDGYLLQHVIARGIPAIGIEPARNIAAVAEARGIPTHRRVLRRRARPGRLVEQCGPADLVVANNVFAQSRTSMISRPDSRALLAPEGVLRSRSRTSSVSMESNQFDTIYHEHFTY